MSTKFSELVKDLEKLKSFLENKTAEEVNTVVDETNRTLLTAATAECGKFSGDGMKFLLNFKGIDINAKDKNNMTPFQTACKVRKIDTNGLLLAKAGADVSLPLRDPETDKIVSWPLVKTAHADDKDSLEAFFVPGNDSVAKCINEMDPSIEKCALHDLVYYGQEAFCKKALELGADPNIRDGEGKTAVFFAIWNSQDSLLEMMVKKFGGKLDFEPDTTSWGFTACTIPVDTGMKRVAEKIMELCGDDDKIKKKIVNTKGAGRHELKGLNAFEFAKLKNRMDIGELFEKYVE